MNKKQSSYGYTTKSELSRYIRIRQARMTIEHGRKFLVRDIETDLARYCNVSIDFIKALKRGLSQPSLAVAIKIAEYFEVQVDEIFILTDKEGDE